MSSLSAFVPKAVIPRVRRVYNDGLNAILTSILPEHLDNAQCRQIKQQWNDQSNPVQQGYEDEAMGHALVAALVSVSEKDERAEKTGALTASIHARLVGLGVPEATVAVIQPQIAGLAVQLVSAVQASMESRERQTVGR